MSRIVWTTGKPLGWTLDRLDCRAETGGEYDDSLLHRDNSRVRGAGDGGLPARAPVLGTPQPAGTLAAPIGSCQSPPSDSRLTAQRGINHTRRSREGFLLRRRSTQ